MRQIVNGYNHFSAVKERNIAVRNVQHSGLLLLEFSIGKFELLFVAVNAAVKGHERFKRIFVFSLL